MIDKWYVAIVRRGRVGGLGMLWGYKTVKVTMKVRMMSNSVVLNRFGDGTKRFVKRNGWEIERNLAQGKALKD